MKSLMEKTRNKFHLSVAEGGFQEFVKTGNITICGLAHDSVYGEKVLTQVENYLTKLHKGEVELLERVIL